MSDLLDMGYINSLPQPFLAKIFGAWWPAYDIDVQTGLFRIDVCGLLETKHFGDASAFRDDNGVEHEPDDFYSDAERIVGQQTNSEGK